MTSTGSVRNDAFERYYLLTTPFLGILASAGLYFLSTRLYASDRPVLSPVVFALLFSLSLAKRLIEDRNDANSSLRHRSHGSADIARLAD